MHRVEQGSFRHEGYTLAYELHGAEEGVPVLLMHGLLLDAAVNRDLAAPLTRAGFRLILLDLLGHGRSDKAEAAELRSDFFAEQVVACLDHLKIDKAVVGGLSLGAIVALHVAVMTPKRVQALFIEMPVMEESTPFAAMMFAPLIYLTDYAGWLLNFFASVAQRMPRPRRGIWESGLNAIAQGPKAIRAILHGVVVGPVVPQRRQRRRIEAPTLIIGHSGDWLHNLEDARNLADELPNARLLVANSIFELRTKPDRLMPEVLQFLQEATGLAPAVTASGTTGTVPASAEVVASSGAAAPDLAARFEAAVEKVRSAPSEGPAKPSNEMKLKMYALYRQAKDGDVEGKRPGMMDVVNRYKYDAWASIKGTSREDAMRRYIEEVQSVERKFGGDAAQNA